MPEGTNGEEFMLLHFRLYATMAAIAAKREAIAVITSGLDEDRQVLEVLNELGETGDIDPAYIKAARAYGTAI